MNIIPATPGYTLIVAYANEHSNGIERHPIIAWSVNAAGYVDDVVTTSGERFRCDNGHEQTVQRVIENPDGSFSTLDEQFANAEQWARSVLRAAGLEHEWDEFESNEDNA